MRKTVILILGILAWLSLLPALTSTSDEKQKELFVVIVKDRRGYIDITGRVVIHPKFESATDFSEGMAVVGVGENGYKEGYIDETGKIVIWPRFDRATVFSQGAALVGVGEFRLHGGGNHKWGFIDKNGNYIIKPTYEDALPFSEGLAPVCVKRNWGYTDRTGRVVIPTQFEYASCFSEGLACVMSKGKLGFIDKSGTLIIRPEFTSASSFSEGLALVRFGGQMTDPRSYLPIAGPLGGEYRYIDKSGNTAITLNADTLNAHPFSEGLAAFDVRRKDGFLYCGYIGKTGETVIEPQFSECDDFSDGLAKIIYQGKFRYINKAGDIAISTDYDLAWSFRGGLAQVRTGDDLTTAKYGYIDRTGKLVWTPSN